MYCYPASNQLPCYSNSNTPCTHKVVYFMVYRLVFNRTLSIYFFLADCFSKSECWTWQPRNHLCHHWSWGAHWLQMWLWCWGSQLYTTTGWYSPFNSISIIYYSNVKNASKEYHYLVSQENLAWQFYQYYHLITRLRFLHIIPVIDFTSCLICFTWWVNGNWIIST